MIEHPSFIYLPRLSKFLLAINASLAQQHVPQGARCQVLATNADLWRKRVELPPYRSLHLLKCTSMSIGYCVQHSQTKLTQMENLQKNFSRLCTKAMKGQAQTCTKPTALSSRRTNFVSQSYIFCEAYTLHIRYHLHSPFPQTLGGMFYFKTQVSFCLNVDVRGNRRES